MQGACQNATDGALPTLDSPNRTEGGRRGAEYFVHGIRLTLDRSADHPDATSEPVTVTGVSDAKVWTPTG